MKNLYLLLFSLSCLGISKTNAQIIDMLDFNGINKPQGALPVGNLTLGGNVLYGMTQSGGINSRGCIFSIHTDSTGYKDIYDFPGGVGGSDPRGQLLLIGNKLYGSAFGGTNDSGFIFSIDTNGKTIKNIFDFDGANGYDINGSFTLTDGMLYGMSYYGGANHYGCVFKVDTDGTRYKDLLDLNGTNGKYVANGVTIAGHKLYGMAPFGAANSGGCIFSIDTDGNSYADLYDFTGATGQNPATSFTLAGTKLYSAAASGGAHTYGCLFYYDTVSKVYKDIYDFPGGAGGNEPLSSLTLSGNVFYGYTIYGGVAEFGNVYSVDTNGTNYTDLLEFDDTDGEYPDAPGFLVLSGTALFGTAEEGGAHGEGTVFSVDTNAVPTSINQLSVNNNQLSVYPNPSSDLIHTNIQLNKNEDLHLRLVNMLGQTVWSADAGNVSAYQKNISVANLPDGVYLLEMVTASGIESQKVIVSH